MNSLHGKYNRTADPVGPGDRLAPGEGFKSSAYPQSDCADDEWNRRMILDRLQMLADLIGAIQAEIVSLRVRIAEQSTGPNVRDIRPTSVHRRAAGGQNQADFSPNVAKPAKPIPARTPN